MRILICGLPGSGKTTLARALAASMDAIHLDGDEVRKAMGNADFSSIGRTKQMRDMKALAEMFQYQGYHVIASFVCPTTALRRVFDADHTIWMDTVGGCQYKDTLDMWEDPTQFTAKFIDKLPVETMVTRVHTAIENPPTEYEWTKPTGLMIGRFQPWHRGHLELLKRALQRYDQMCIMIRTMPTDAGNPQTAYEVYNTINDSLTQEGLDNRVQVIFGPNVEDVVHGRTPGWGVVQLTLAPEIEKISGTQIRKDLTKKPRVVSSSPF